MFSIVDLKGLSILEQLHLEEALLRIDKGNWCLINSEAADAIVLGISGKREQLVEEESYSKRPVPLIKRFSGGGTVYIDPETIFITFIANEKESVPCLPRKIMKWTEELYKPFFAPHPFVLEENDYVMGNKKFGGNAQYLQKGRWLHHTSFLWDYLPEKMAYLKHPPKQPNYRQNRPHKEFLTTLNHYYPNKKIFIKELTSYLQKTLSAKKISIEEIMPLIEKPHRRGTVLLDPSKSQNLGASLPNIRDI